MSSLSPKPLKVGVVQMQSADDVSANVRAALLSIRRLADQGCRLICLPENALFFRIEKNANFDTRVNLQEDYWAEFVAVAKKTATHILVGSVPYSTGQQKPANTTIWVKPSGELSPCYDKIHLFDVDVKGAPPVRESDVFSHGHEPKVIDIEGWRVGLSICYDMRFSELYTYYRKHDVQLILVPSAFLVPTGQAHWHVLLRARAIESQCFVVAAAQAGEHKSASGSTRHTYGHSLIIGPWGDILAESNKAGPDELIFELNPESIIKVRAQIPMASHRRL